MRLFNVCIWIYVSWKLIYIWYFFNIFISIYLWSTWDVWGIRVVALVHRPRIFTATLYSARTFHHFLTHQRRALWAICIVGQFYDATRTIFTAVENKYICGIYMYYIHIHLHIFYIYVFVGFQVKQIFLQNSLSMKFSNANILSSSLQRLWNFRKIN